jgi:PilZ domain-containing protein
MTVDERRASGNERVPFEALVAVEAEGESRFQCEAVDLSAGGLRLRTAYLPTLGRQLRCRFYVGGAERKAVARVVWRVEQTRGGEFGVAFDELEPRAREAIEMFCGIEPARSKAGARAADKGDRVRLHIDGLGSPMRARVQDVETGKLTVGSNLEFLRLGRPLSVEDVDKGQNLSAVIDGVGVEVDPGSHVPQLLVGLRCEKEAAEPSAGEAARAEAEARPAARDEAPAPVEAPAAARVEAAPDEAAVASAGGPEGAGAEAAGEGRAAALMATLRASAGQLGPRLEAATERLKGASALVLRRLRKDEAETSGKRTTTQMPTVPSGEGRRGFGAGRDGTMEEQQEAAEAAAAGVRSKAARRWLALGGAGVAAALLATLAIKTRGDAPPGADAARAPEAVAAAEGASLAAAPPRPAGDAVTANVPLFGPTPLSTIEPVAVPPGAPVPSFAAGAPGAAPAGAQMAAGPRVDAGGEAQGASSYGRGEVRRPRTVRLQMDAPVGALRGNVADGSLTVTVVGRHNIEPAGPLARRDPRIASVKAVPVGDDTEVTLAFKDNVPPFLAKASGRTLEIDLGAAEGKRASADDDGDGDEPRAKKRRTRRSHGATAQRHGAKGERGAKHDDDRRHADEGDRDERRRDAGKDDRRHEGKDDKRHADGKDDKRHADKDDKRHEGKDDKRHADGKDDKRRSDAGKDDKRHEGKGDKRRAARPNHKQDRDDERDD